MKYVMRKGKLVQATTADATNIRQHDSKNIVSVASGIHPKQIPEFNRRFGHMGVKYHPKTGKAIYKDRNSKLAVLQARGIVDHDEVRGTGRVHAPHGASCPTGQQG